MPVPTREAAVLESLVPEMEAEGFDVYVHPQPKHVPGFLEGLRPDVIAYKGDRRVLVEIVKGEDRSKARVEDVQRRLSGHPGWELRLVYAEPASPMEDIPVASQEVIKEHLDRVEGALGAMGAPAALLAAWASLEAAARVARPDVLGRPQTPARLSEVLASEGQVTPDEADALRVLGRARNGIAHGRLDLAVTEREVRELIRITRSLLSHIGFTPPGARGF